MTDDTILLHGDDDSGANKEGEADGTITPGDLIDLSGTGASGATTERLFVRNSTDGTRQTLVALEQSYAGRGIDDDYSDGDALVYKRMEPGDEFYMFVFDGSNAASSGTDTSDNANISVGDKLVPYSGGGQDGTLRAYDSTDGDTAGAVIAEATEAVDNSGGSSPARIKVEAV